jgi:hypothetical protein
VVGKVGGVENVARTSVNLPILGSQLILAHAGDKLSETNPTHKP